jgi:hypothetical protein
MIFLASLLIGQSPPTVGGEVAPALSIFGPNCSPAGSSGVNFVKKQSEQCIQIYG